MCAGAMLVSGCGGNKETANTNTNTPGSTTIASTGSGAGTASPGQLVASKVQLPSDPNEVVRLFFDSMRQGNGDQISALLSTAAREEIRRKDLKIDPLGSPLAEFKIGESALQNDAMLISSTWSEPEQNGQPATELEVVWELRKEEAGWRICGMAVDPQTGEEVQVVNFEHLEPEAPAAPEQRMASLPNAPAGNTAPVGNATNAMPQQPSFGQQNGFPAASAPSNNFGSPALPQGGTVPAPQGGLPAIVPANQQLPPVTSAPNGFSLPPAAGANPGNGSYQLPGGPVQR